MVYETQDYIKEHNILDTAYVSSSDEEGDTYSVESVRKS
jgi:hypothetical protein